VYSVYMYSMYSVYMCVDSQRGHSREPLIVVIHCGSLWEMVPNGGSNESNGGVSGENNW